MKEVYQAFWPLRMKRGVLPEEAENWSEHMSSRDEFRIY